MKFDILTSYPCIRPPSTPPCAPIPSASPPPTTCCDDPDFADSNPNVCIADDPRCSDPAFAQANLGLCPNAARLILKPAYALKESLQQLAYQLFWLKGGTESLVASGVTFQCASTAVAAIGGASGKCTAVAPGIATISASWGGLTAYAQLEVVPSCPSEETDFAILIDHSLSMSQQFSSLYPTKLAFAKDMASKFADSVNYSKDKVSVWQFSTQGTQLLSLSQDVNAVKSAIGGIGQTQNRTNINGPLGKVITSLQNQSAPNKTLVVVLFSDGENKTGGNPLPEAETFTSGAGVIFVVGCRAYDGGFMLLEDIASGGFFINALSSNQGSVPSWLSGLKSYLCSGNCDPVGGRTIPRPSLNYTGFINWDVTSGVVDLIGAGGSSLYDILPGNGLYPDMCGSSAPWLGTLTGKAAKMPAVAAGANYSVALYAAGNQRETQEGRQLQVKVTVNSVVQANHTITITDWLMPFTQYAFAFNSTQSGTAIISIGQITNPGNQSYGTPVDVITLTNTDTSTVLFSDNFDNENSTFLPSSGGIVPAACGSIKPAKVQIVGYHDGFFDLSGCDFAGLTLCGGSTAWDGSFSYQGGCSWQDTVAGLTMGGALLLLPSITFNEDAQRWNMAITLVTCDGMGNHTGSLTVWYGEKYCGEGPDGPFQRFNTCAGPATLDVVAVAPGINSYGCAPMVAYGCLDEPIPAQVPDPSPNKDVESCSLTG